MSSIIRSTVCGVLVEVLKEHRVRNVFGLPGVAAAWGQEDQVDIAMTPQLQAQLANYPPLECPHSLAAGFEHDGTLEALTQRALQ